MTLAETRMHVARARRTGDGASLADALVALASELVPTGGISEARAALDEAAAVHEMARRRNDERHCRQFSATLSRLLGDLEGARSRATRAAQLSSSGSPDAVSAAAELGEIALAASDPARAAHAFGQSLLHAENDMLRPADLAGLLRKHAAALALAGETEEAVRSLDRAHALLAKAGDATNAIRTEIEAVTVLQNAGKTVDAATRRTRALALARQCDDHHALADLEILEAAAAIENRDVTAALASAGRAREQSLQANAPVSYIAAATTMAELHQRNGDRLSAYAVLATGYVTLGDLLGTETGREAFEPKLRACRERWGASEFKRIKAEYESHQRAARSRSGQPSR